MEIKLESLSKLNSKYHSKIVNGWLWIRILDGLHMIEFDLITTAQYMDGKRLITFSRGGNSIIVFNENQLKGKLRVAKVDDDLIQYDLF